MHTLFDVAISHMVQLSELVVPFITLWFLFDFFRMLFLRKV